MFKLLYKTGKTEKEFSKLEWVNKSGKENDEISPFFQEHLKNIFPKLTFVFKQNRKETTRYKFSKRRELDAICWYPKGNFFIIFEYKSKKPREIIDQVFEYWEVFSGENNEDCRKLFNDLNESLPKGESVLWENIEWGDLKLVWISPELPSQNQNSKYFEVPGITWVKSEWYENSGEIAVRLDSEDKESLLEQLSRKESEVEKPKSPKMDNLTQLLQKIKFSEKEVEEWVEKFHKSITGEFLLNTTIRYYPYYHDPGIIEYREGKTMLFWARVSENSLRVCFDPRKEENLVPLAKKYESLSKPKMYWSIKIKDEKTFLESLQIIKEILTITRK